MRRQTRKIKCGHLHIGGDAPISIQSMTTTDTRDVKATVAQIHALEEVGCDIVRVAVPDMTAAKALGAIKKEIHIPLVADIHFDYRLALEAMEQGVDKLRLNPGNIGDRSRVELVVTKAKEKNIPIRIGVNAGSISEKIIEKHGGITAEAMVDSAMEHIRILEDMDFHDIVISLKAHDVALTLEAYEKISEVVDYPLHLGITEAGTKWAGTIKSSVGIGAMLLKGLGDTLRVSLTGEPTEEIEVGKEILKATGIRKTGLTLISCPTCGRCNIDLINLANRVEKALKNVEKPIEVAIMGCAVNGPGEAKEADIGIAGGKGSALLFRKGEIIRKIPEGEIEQQLLAEIEKL